MQGGGILETDISTSTVVTAQLQQWPLPRTTTTTTTTTTSTTINPTLLLTVFIVNCSLDGSSTLIYAEQKIKWTRFSFKTIWGKNWSLRVITYYYYFFSRFYFIVLQRQFVDALPVRNCHLANMDNWARYGSNIIIR